MEVNLFDDNFRHMLPREGYDACCHTEPKRVKWVRDQMSWDGITVFSDENCFSGISKSVRSDIKVAWLCEPPAIRNLAGSIKYVQNDFDIIVSYLSNEILQVDEKKYVWAPFGGAWVTPLEFATKTKKVSMIASSKNDAPGHKLRHEVARMSQGNIDLMGHGYKSIKSKLEGHADYRFSVVIENSSHPKYFTEKLIDCLLCKCVPIYWGATEISDIFDSKGILRANNADEILRLISGIDESDYENLTASIMNNFEISKSLVSVDDNVFDAIISKLNNQKVGKRDE